MTKPLRINVSKHSKKLFRRSNKTFSLHTETEHNFKKSTNSNAVYLGYQKIFKRFKIFTFDFFNMSLRIYNASNGLPWMHL